MHSVISCKILAFPPFSRSFASLASVRGPSEILLCFPPYGHLRLLYGSCRNWPFKFLSKSPTLDFGLWTLDCRIRGFTGPMSKIPRPARDLTGLRVPGGMLHPPSILLVLLLVLVLDPAHPGPDFGLWTLDSGLSSHGCSRVLTGRLTGGLQKKAQFHWVLTGSRVKPPVRHPLPPGRTARTGPDG